MPLHQLVYLSTANQVFSDYDLVRLLHTARPRNEKNGLTGILLHQEGDFLQVLEGRRAFVHETFGRIQRDPRHGRFRVLADGPLQARAFPDWRMGFVTHSPAVFAHLHGIVLPDAPTLIMPTQIAEVPPGASLQELLEEFAHGPHGDDALPG